jgi:anthranilate phosphoribosyltransferase
MENHSLVQKIIERHNLSRKDVNELLIDIINKDDEGFRLLSFSIALLTKGETVDELLGIMDALNHFTKIDKKAFPQDIMDISSSGGGMYRKLNISTLSALIVGNKELPIAKQSFWGITSTTGSANILQHVGLTVPQINVSKLAESLKSIGIGYYHHLFMFPELKNLVNFGIILNEKNLGVNTPFNLIGPIYTPIKLKYRMFGVNSINQINKVYDLFKGLKYKNFLVLHGKGGIDEASIFSDTIIKGVKNDKFFEETINPSTFGLQNATYESVKPESSESNIKDFLRVIYGLEKGPKRDMVLMNSSLGLYISNQTNDLKEGIEISLSYIESGIVKQKFENLIKNYGDEAVLNSMLKKYVF